MMQPLPTCSSATSSAQLVPAVLLTALLLSPTALAQPLPQLGDRLPPGLLSERWQPVSSAGSRVQGEQQQDWQEPRHGVDGERLLASRSMLWVGRSPASRWRVGLGLEQLRPWPGSLGGGVPQGEVWGGVRMNLSADLSWSVETPLWVRDESQRASGLRFERPGKEGLASLRNALRYRLGPESEIVVKPRRSKFSVTYTARW